MRWLWWVVAVYQVNYALCYRAKWSCLKMASVGIDLGTTYSLCSTCDANGKISVIPVQGAKLVPSIVRYCKDSHSMLVGNEAATVATGHDRCADQSFASMKRVIGMTKNEVLSMHESYYCGKLAHDLGGSKNGDVAKFRKGTGGEVVSAEEIAADIIRLLKSSAAEALRGASTKTITIDKAVITVPAYFNNAQRAATERAGKLAGLDKVKLLKEPEAAAIAYGLNLHTPQVILVFDLGGGTLDVSVLEVGDGMVEVIATTGDPYLGGDDFDSAVAEWALDQLVTQAGCTTRTIEEIRDDSLAMARVRQAARAAKEALTTQPQAEISVPTLHTVSGLGLHTVLTRRQFEALVKPLLKRLLLPLREVALMAGVNLPGESGQVGSDLGGAAEWGMVEDESPEGHEPDRNSLPLSAADMKREQVLGRKEARERRKVAGQSRRELRRVQRSAGSGGGGGGALTMFPAGRAVDALLLVGGATRMPCVRQAVQTMTGLTALPPGTIHPDEAVCVGAGIMAGMLDGVIPDMRVVSHWQSTVLRFMQEHHLGARNSKY